jgi:hypothetical protein
MTTYKLIKDCGRYEVVEANEGDKFTFPTKEAAMAAKWIAYEAMGVSDFVQYDHRNPVRSLDFLQEERVRANKKVTRTYRLNG